MSESDESEALNNEFWLVGELCLSDKSRSHFLCNLILLLFVRQLNQLYFSIKSFFIRFLFTDRKRRIYDEKTKNSVRKSRSW